jgi:hypothetical protein
MPGSQNLMPFSSANAVDGSNKAMPKKHARTTQQTSRRRLRLTTPASREIRHSAYRYEPWWSDYNSIQAHGRKSEPFPQLSVLCGKKRY